MKSIESANGIPRKDLIKDAAGVLAIKVLSFPLAQEKLRRLSKQDTIAFILLYFSQTSGKLAGFATQLHLRYYFLDERNISIVKRSLSTKAVLTSGEGENKIMAVLTILQLTHYSHSLRKFFEAGVRFQFMQHWISDAEDHAKAGNSYPLLIGLI